jgi:hypothetical protein
VQPYLARTGYLARNIDSARIIYMRTNVNLADDDRAFAEV